MVDSRFPVGGEAASRGTSFSADAGGVVLGGQGSRRDGDVGAVAVQQRCQRLRFLSGQGLVAQDEGVCAASGVLGGDGAGAAIGQSVQCSSSTTQLPLSPARRGERVHSGRAAA